MADITASVVNPNRAGTALATPIPVTAAPGGDTFVSDYGATYLVRAANGHSSPQNIVVDDPTTAAIPGATTPANPDITHIIPNATQRTFMIDANRHRNPTTGVISLSYSGTTLLTFEIYKVHG